jgi:Concanavalin A-like lectin/glucanases superfamily/Fibronectin type III domain
MLSALLLLPFSSLAWADAGNLLPNGSFQSGTSGWSPSDAAFTIASDGANDNYAGRLALNTSATSYQLAASPRPVLNTSAGIVYTANGVVRSDTPGKSVCLMLKELTSGGTLVLKSDACAPTSSQWAALPQVTLTAANNGDRIAFLVKRSSGAVAGESFEVDDLSLVASGASGGGTAPSTPTNVRASAVAPTEIDVSWSASSDPDPDGVAGYAIYRDGSGSPTGTVGGSTTSFPDTSVAPGSTHTYTVAAFDAAGHYSQHSAPSNAATTPPLPQSSVVGLWHLDETSGTTAYDSSGHGHDGAISGPVTLGVPGVSGTAYSFVPKSTVIVPNASELVPGTARITISYWMNATTPPPSADYDMFTKGDASSGGGQIKLEVQPNGQASCQFRGALGARQLQAGPNVVDGQWHKVICVRDGNQIVETVDGATFSVTKATGAITVTDPVRLGSHKNGGDWYRGILDEVSYSIG